MNVIASEPSTQIFKLARPSNIITIDLGRAEDAQVEEEKVPMYAEIEKENIVSLLRMTKVTPKHPVGLRAKVIPQNRTLKISFPLNT